MVLSLIFGQADLTGGGEKKIVYFKRNTDEQSTNYESRMNKKEKDPQPVDLPREVQKRLQAKGGIREPGRFFARKM